MEKTTGGIRIEHLEDFSQVFQETFNAGDLDGLVSLFEPEAVLVAGPSQVATGTDAIREALAGFLAAWGHFEIKVLSRHQVGDIGLQTAEWKVENSDPEDSRGRLALDLCTSFAGRRTDRGVTSLTTPFPSGDHRVS